MIVTTHSQDETAAVGRGLASRLAAGSVLLLIGDLGAGKTALVRGLAEGLGVPPEDLIAAVVGNGKLREGEDIAWTLNFY